MVSIDCFRKKVSSRISTRKIAVIVVLFILIPLSFKYDTSLTILYEAHMKKMYRLNVDVELHFDTKHLLRIESVRAISDML